MSDNSIWVETMVASRTGEPFVTLRWYDHSAELTPSEARAHALTILEAAEAAEGDAALIAFARKANMPPNMQAGILQAFREFREQQAKGKEG